MKEKSLSGRVGILGGTFDPVHLGHLLLAEQAAEQLRLQHVLWIPAAIAPHQKIKHSTDQKQRLEMVQLATAGNPRFTVDDRELRRGGQSYTVDTLQELQRDFPEVEWILLMGGDSLRGLPMWRDPHRICALAQVVVVTRGGQAPPDMQILANYLPASTDSEAAFQKDTHAELQGIIDNHLLPMPQLEISSTDIRDRVKLGKSIRYMVPAAVEAFIVANGLYREQ